MSNKRTLILDKEQIHQKSIRIAYQILEDNFEEESIVLVGIADRGYVFATRLQQILRDLAPQKSFELLKVTIAKTKRKLEASVDGSITIAENKVIVLVDDVLNSGRTLAYGLGMFLDVPLKKMRTAVLIDRSHHQFPLFSDYYGLKLSTILKEHVEVVLSEFDGEEDAAWLS
ncbi:pyrimidine operon attenuation protein/uracil phosphoribosyltransferase [Sphingobacterium allocomposti]|uniref:Pyrimidine operon attenuation protein/uracil phosphoribosyltransferase n=1 Tax=Sphingobacterium allocomposti TaxID=415956 RepID=A0A5S5DNL5_9SPHI|nr:phosphoribosyltransferase family protein [Sphingobacterium composti Yoo et al. 2007 non Ten et al. 2007]TYP96402.1 pyrimidine operon attenuation protein/uracil phosphoribosyltransferase [Sphingobacterium composti Yoo et al. 2007 non Ten et al. 2007]